MQGHVPGLIPAPGRRLPTYSSDSEHGGNIELKVLRTSSTFLSAAALGLHDDLLGLLTLTLLPALQDRGVGFHLSPWAPHTLGISVLTALL